MSERNHIEVLEDLIRFDRNHDYTRTEFRQFVEEVKAQWEREGLVDPAGYVLDPNEYDILQDGDK